MLSTAIIIPDEKEKFPFDTFRNIEGIEWDGIFYAGKRVHTPYDRAQIFSSPEIIPLLCDLLIVGDPQFCTFDFLSFAIRSGCHLFLTDKLNLNAQEHKQLVHLANEGGTYIRIQNDFMFHPFLEQIRNQFNLTAFIEASQTAPGKYDQINELLYNNLLVILRAAGSVVHKVDLFCGTRPYMEPDVINIHINFKNGSVATLTLKFCEQEPAHLLSIHSGGETTTVDFEKNKINRWPLNQPAELITGRSENPLREQIIDFILTLKGKHNPGLSLNDEITVFLLMEKIQKKIENQFNNIPV